MASWLRRKNWLDYLSNLTKFRSNFFRNFHTLISLERVQMKSIAHPYNSSLWLIVMSHQKRTFENLRNFYLSGNFQNLSVVFMISLLLVENTINSIFCFVVDFLEPQSRGGGPSKSSLAPLNTVANFNSTSSAQHGRTVDKSKGYRFT